MCIISLVLKNFNATNLRPSPYIKKGVMFNVIIKNAKQFYRKK